LIEKFSPLAYPKCSHGRGPIVTFRAARTDAIGGWSIHSGWNRHIFLGFWHLANEGFQLAIALAMLVLALAAFCPEPS
jgi:hypothetical protein